MPIGWCIDKVASLLMWSGSEVTQAITKNMALKMHVSDLHYHMYTFACVCAEQDREENSSRHKWYNYRLYCT